MSTFWKFVLVSICWGGLLSMVCHDLAHGADPRTDFCISLAEVLKTTAIARDQGIPLETVRATLRETTRTPAQQSALDNMVRVIYLRTYTPTQIGENALTQCLAQME